MTTIRSIDQLGNPLEQGLYMNQKSRRVTLVTNVNGNSYSTKYFPGPDGKRTPARYLIPLSPEFASNLLQQQDFIVWLNDQTRGNPSLGRDVGNSLGYRTSTLE